MKIPDSVRPMLFENEDPAIRLSMRGSCFLVRRNGRNFGLTAKHNVLAFHPKQYRALKSFGSNECFSFDQPFTVESGREDFTDFVVIPLMNVQPSEQHYFSDLIDTGIAWSKVKRVIVAGFPSELVEFNYEESIEYQPVSFLAELMGDSIDEGMREIRVCNPGNVESFSGMSGSPVYYQERLIGIVLRGSRDTAISQSMHFLDVRVISAVIDLAISDHA